MIAVVFEMPKLGNVRQQQSARLFWRSSRYLT